MEKKTKTPIESLPEPTARRPLDDETLQMIDDVQKVADDVKEKLINNI